ncbi:MAG: transposase [Thermoanaerobaculia bacterium]
MGRRLRYIPAGGALVEVTARTVGARYLLKPSKELNEAIVGVFARAQRFYEVPLHALVCMSNHFHALISVEDACQMARFMNYVNGNLAKEAGRFNDWHEKFWGRRYQAIVVSGEESEQVERLRYILSHGCKEGLVARPRDWPGVNTAQALLDGTPLKGLWFDRSREHAARMRGKAFHRLEFANVETLELEPIPCYRHLSEAAYRSWVAEVIGDIETETSARHRQEETVPLGATIATAISAHQRPTAPKKSWAPLVHAATTKVRKEFREAYGWFVAAYREAAEKLRQGDLSAAFPAGSFIPSLAMIDWRYSGQARAPG